MAPNGDAAVAAAPPATPAPVAPPKQRRQKPRRISMEGLQRAMSDLALELARERKQSSSMADHAAANNNKSSSSNKQLPAITEQQQQVETARCECCGMQEECTPAYVRLVRDRYCGRWVCGLCAAAVNGEAETRHGGRTEEALAAHMAVCGRFNRVGRANPVLMQTEAMREILRKRSRSNSPREHGLPGGLTRSTSCIPAITKDFN